MENLSRDDFEESDTFDTTLPSGASLYEHMLDYAIGARSQRPDWFDPQTNTWTEIGRARMKDTYPSILPEDMDRVLDRTQKQLKNKE